MYFGNLAQSLASRKSYKVTVLLRRNNDFSGSHSSTYYAESMSDVFHTIFEDFKLFRGEKIDKIRVSFQ